MSEESRTREVEAAYDDLYAAPLDQFIPTRKKLAGQLKSAGDQQGASEISKAPKPTAAAWALNQLSRKHAKKLEWFFEANEKVSRAQAGGKADEFRSATRARHDVVGQLVETAAKLYEAVSGTAPAAFRKKVADTLYAVSSDDRSANLLRSGRLTKELEPTGFGDASSGGWEAPQPPAKKLGQQIEKAQARVDAAQQEADRLRADAAQLEKAADLAEGIAERARIRAERALRDAEAAARKADEERMKLDRLKDQT